MSPRVLHVITDLQVGGAELMLHRLLSRRQHEAAVVSLKTLGPVGEQIRELGVPVEALGMRPGVPDPRALLRLARRIRAFRADLVQSWLYHADLMGGLAARLAGVPVVWNVRQSNLDPRLSKRHTLWTARLCAVASRWLPRQIICCSESAREVHAALGYDAGKLLVIPNGYELSRFRPDPQARLEVRRELEIPVDAPLVGLFGRFDPQKDHATFVAAAARLRALSPEVHFVLCGGGIEWANEELAGPIRAAGLEACTRLLGRRSDMPRLTAALDLATSSSAYGEGFPNVIAEAMACEIPCVVTNIGDSARLVGELGEVVPPRDPAALAAAWARTLQLDGARRRELGGSARRHIAEHFSLDAVVRRYEEVYQTAGGEAGGIPAHTTGSRKHAAGRPASNDMTISRGR